MSLQKGNNPIKKRDFLEIDWSKIPYVFYLIMLFLISRLPLLNLGFGYDSDAWRMANTAYDLRYFHIYHTSRFPGFPIPEFLNSLVINYGWTGTNALTMIFSLISVIFFAKILSALNVKRKGLLVLTYNFFPLLWINSTNTMGYMWALAFIIISWYSILKKRFILAGVMFGIATGCRITSTILIFPFLYLIFTESKNWKHMLYFFLSFIIVSLVFFTPLIARYNLGFLKYYPHKVKIKDVFFKFINKFGILTLITGGLFSLTSMRAFFRNIAKKDKDSIFLLSSIIIFFLLFLKAPYEVEYFIPAIPFGLILINKIWRKELTIIFSLFLMSNAVVEVNVGNFTGEGIVTKSIQERRGQIRFTHHLLNAKVKAHSVVIVGYWVPTVVYFKKVTKGENNDIHYIYSASSEKINELHKNGYNIYYLGMMRDYTKRVYGYDLNDLNCKHLRVYK
ncbi:MAG: hypothetical protein B5M53_06700 [Candidatus Cloacimonas sp. 4484_209]|nr:MAG: hypothetical protein B5M53_06700 [Candidatus Cloacimonas sp. 4484_209]